MCFYVVFSTAHRAAACLMLKMSMVALSMVLIICISTTAALAESDRVLVVHVDSVNGNDSDCSSLQELSQAARFNVTDSPDSLSNVPCKTLNRAFGSIDCYNSCRYGETNNDSLQNVVVRLFDGVHRLTDCIAIDGGQNVTMEAVNDGQATVECAYVPDDSNNIVERRDGIRVCRSEGLVFRGVRFEHCGPHSPAAVFLNRSSMVLFEDCVFAHNTGAPLWSQFVPSLTLLRTSFLHNQNQILASVDSENTTIDRLFVTITTSGAVTFYSRGVEAANIMIKDCTFYNNSAGRNSINNTRPVLLKANGHGGAVLIRLAKIEAASITISNSTFVNNFAEIDGGAVYFSFSENFSSSSVSIHNCQFVNNTALESSGGAISLNSYRGSFNNSFIIQDSEFELNQADSGGALGIALYDTTIDSFDLPDSASLENCSFYGNVARNEGTAVGLFSLIHVDESGFPVNFTNCTFRENTALQVSADHVSALVSFRFPIHLSGYNHFISNTGGGISLLNSALTVAGELLLDSNTATYGAGIALDDICLIEVSPGANVTFANNYAEEAGGGIHVDFPAIRYTTTIFNRHCFLQYNHPTEGRNLPPMDWKRAGVSINFINNTAGLKGAAIYASDLRLCSWIGNDYPTDVYSIFELPKEIEHLSPFLYINNSLKAGGQNDTTLATAPYQIFVEPEHETVQPGERLPIIITVKDQVNNSREAIWSLEGPHGDSFLDGISTTSEVYFYSVPDLESLVQGREVGGVCNSELVRRSTSDPKFVGNFTLIFSLPGTLGLIETQKFNFTKCHPGYAIDSSTCLCSCDRSNRDIVRCDTNTTRYIYLRSGVWGGVEIINGEKTFVTANVLPSYVECSQEGRLPGCLLNTGRPDDQCREGRYGRLCGVCDDDYGVTLDLQACSPSDQCVAGLALFLFFCILVVIVSLLILFFNLEVPNELKGFIFYAQVIGLIYRPFIAIQSADSAIDPLGTILNLLGFSVPISLCVSSSLRAHHAALLGYISPLLALFTVIGYLVAARFIKRLGNRSALKGITFLFLFIYKYIADTSFILISCNNTSFGLVFQYDGTLSCTGIEFGLFVLVGLALVVFFVAPAPLAVGYICRKRPLHFQHYADILTKGLKKQHRWFGGWDIGRRLPFVFFGYFLGVARPSLILFLMTVSAVFVLMSHVLTKPYEKTYINIIETLILLNLAAVTVVYLNPSANHVPQWLTTLLVLLPFVYCLVYILWRISRRVWQNVFTEKFRESSFRKLGGRISQKLIKSSLLGSDSTQIIATDTGQLQYTSDLAYVAYSQDSDHRNNTTQSERLSDGGNSGSRLNTRDDSFTDLRESLLEP